MSTSSSVMIESRDADNICGIGSSSGSSSNSSTDASVVARKLAAAESRRARNAARDLRSRLFSDSSDEAPKGILKNGGRIPTKRSASECVDDLAQIMADLNLTIQDLSNSRYCPLHHRHQRYSSVNEEEEEEREDEDNEDHNDADDDDDGEEYEDDHSNLGDEELEGKLVKKDNNSKIKMGKTNNTNKRCDCNLSQSGDSDIGCSLNKPKKSVRFNDHVYEAFYFAARLYDRRDFVKYHFSSRHHPPPKQQSNKSKKNKNKKKKSSSNSNSSKKSMDDSSNTNNNNQDSNPQTQINGAAGYKPTKSQRAKQSKRDKLKQRRRSETNSDDQGYCSSLHSSYDS